MCLKANMIKLSFQHDDGKAGKKHSFPVMNHGQETKSHQEVTKYKKSEIF